MVFLKIIVSLFLGYYLSVADCESLLVKQVPYDWFCGHNFPLQILVMSIAVYVILTVAIMVFRRLRNSA